MSVVFAENAKNDIDTLQECPPLSASYLPVPANNLPTSANVPPRFANVVLRI